MTDLRDGTGAREDAHWREEFPVNEHISGILGVTMQTVTFWAPAALQICSWMTFFKFLSTVENQDTKTSHTFNLHSDVIRKNYVIKRRYFFSHIYILFHFYLPLDFKSNIIIPVLLLHIWHLLGEQLHLVFSILKIYNPWNKHEVTGPGALYLNRRSIVVIHSMKQVL